MKIIVVGGSGLIGSKLVRKLTEQGHEAIVASPSSGVNTLTGEGLREVVDGASVVVDVTNSPSFEDRAVLDFFRTSTGNILAAEAAARAGHHVALSVVGADRLPENGYYRAKAAQEALIKDSSVPYSIVRATQFFEFVDELIRRVLSANGDPREVITDPHALLFGAELEERSLLPGDDALIFGTRFQDWSG